MEGPSNTGTGIGTEEAEQLARRLQDLHLPVANVTRIMRRKLPQHARVTDNTKEAVQKLMTRYIHNITKKANERCKREQRRTVTAEDVLWAMNKIGLTNYVGPLTLYLHKYREQEAEGSLNTHMPNIVRPNFDSRLRLLLRWPRLCPLTMHQHHAIRTHISPPNGLFYNPAAMMNDFSMNFRNKMVGNDDSPTESSSSSNATNYGMYGVKDPYEQFKQ